MADPTKVSQKTKITDPQLTDILYIVINPASVPQGGYLALSYLKELILVDHKTRYAEIPVFAPGQEWDTGDGKAYLHIPPEFDGMNLVYVHGRVITAGTTGTGDVQIYNVTNGVDMLSTKLTVDSGETGSEDAATDAVIDTNNDEVSENDLLRVDVDAKHTTAAKGLIVTLGFQTP